MTDVAQIPSELPADCLPPFPQDLSRVTDVAQIPSEEMIARLTVRQCKRLLLHRRTDYRDVIEKEELLRRVRLLWRETRRNSAGRCSLVQDRYSGLTVEVFPDFRHDLALLNII